MDTMKYQTSKTKTNKISSKKPIETNTDLTFPQMSILHKGALQQETCSKGTVQMFNDRYVETP